MNPNDPQQIDKKVSALIAQMTLEEKLAQLGSCWVYELHTKGKPDDRKISQRLS